MTKEERTKLIRHLKYNRSIGADYLITDKDADEIIKALEQRLCDDVISREAVLDIVDSYSVSQSNVEDVTQDIISDIVMLSPVTSQPKMGYISIDDVMSVFHDFMCDEVDEEGTETFLEMLKDKAEIA